MSLTEEKPKIRVWIASVNDDLLQNCKQLLSATSKYEVSDVFRNGDYLARKIKLSQPDLILMDFELPELGGVRYTTMVKYSYPQITVVMLASEITEELVLSSLRAGASGYLVKSPGCSDLIDGLLEIELGGAPVTRSTVKLLVESFHRNRLSPLSRRETEILTLVAEGKTYSQVSDQLFVARDTTKAHMRNIFKKLAVNSRAEAIAKARKEHFI